MHLELRSGKSFDIFSFTTTYFLVKCLVQDVSATRYARSIIMTSDNFSFQNNGIKKCTCWKTMGFLRKQWVFWENNGYFKAMFFNTTSHMIYFDYKAYAFYQNKNYSCFT